ncbi:preprotein translocase subunit YajC [Nocardioides aequoreus]|uniref:preprotein translocase subunit YajC n=1 Tax=Nocardioides aequoreus TaxID=397278 RepID=UPI00068EEB8C|nr:preprotein translocase subunit YajC [Nocardioides aequoreus]
MSEAGPLLFILLTLVVFWFLLLRPARNQQKQARQLQAELTVGQEIVLNSGIFGTIRGLGDQQAQIEIAPGTVVTVARQAVVRRVEDLPPAARPGAVTPAKEREPVQEHETPRETDQEPGDEHGTPRGQV